MRTRIRALVAVAGIAVAVLFVAAPANAADAKPKIKEAEEHCIKLLENGGTLDDCQKAPSPLKPATNEVIWGTAAFAVLLVAMWKFGVPAVKNMEKAREDRIRNDLEGAHRGRGREGAVPRADCRCSRRGGPDHRGSAAVGRAGAA